MSCLDCITFKTKITKEFKKPMKETFLLKDSNTILYYLQNKDRNFGIYVSHRINKILENTELNKWNYVSSESNIVDQTSRY